MTLSRPPVINVTASALARLKVLLASRGKSSAGIRIGVRSRGCNGLSYTLEYADETHQLDEIIEKDGIKIFIDPKATLYLLGTSMDFIEERLQSGFVFRNPNEKGTCGCGESFHV